MINKFFQSFKKLPKSNRAMIYLMWLYNARGVIGGLFLNIYIFQINKELLDVIIYNIIFFTSSFFGFSILGYLASIFKKDIKNMYYISYLIFIISFLLLLVLNSSFLSIIIFSILYGIGNGAFWCAVHSQELVNIEDKTRDIYSSNISAGGNIISIIMPLFVSLIFFISNKYLDISGYTIIFIFLPFLYLISFLFIKDIGKYMPSKIGKNDLKNFFNKKYKFGLLYILNISFYQGISLSIGAVLAIYMLKSEVNVGLLEGIMALISTIIVVFIGFKRNTNNRIKIMGIVVSFIFINYLIFIFNFNLIGFIIFSLILIILGPLFRVSEHVYDLKIMDTIKYEKSDFFPAMILREIILWVGRTIIIGVIFVINYYLGSDIEKVLKLCLILVPIFMFFAFLSIYMHSNYEITNKKGTK